MKQFLSFFSGSGIFSYSTFIDPLLKDLRDFIWRFSEIESGGKILDVGCGTGEQALFFAKKNFVAFGIDFNPKMIKIAKEKNKKQGLNACFQTGDAVNLPFSNSTFDASFISLVLHEIEREKRFRVISEMKRVTKKGGSLIFVDFNCPLPTSKISFFVKTLEFLGGRLNYENFRDYLKNGGLLNLLEESGLKIEKTEYFKKNLLVAARAKNL